jgi:hypothetical protein
MIPPGDDQNHDKEWADMKTGWRATSIAESFMTEKLRWSLRMRMLGSWLWLAGEILAGVLLAVLAVLQATMGNIGAAIGLTVLNVLAAGASFWARRAPLRSASGSLMDLIELAIHRARRSERFAWAQYFTVAACVAYVVAAVFGIAGPPETYRDFERATVALVIFGLYAAGVGIYHWFARRRGRRFAELRQSFLKQENAAA